MANSVDGKVRPQEFQKDPLGGTPTVVVDADVELGNTVIKTSAPTTYGDRVPVTVKVTMATGGSTAGDMLAWKNPTGGNIIVTHFAIDVTTVSSGAATIDAGVAANGTTSSDTLVDGASIQTTARVIDNVKDAGTNGTSAQKMTSTQYITCSEASGDTTGFAGAAYITYVRA